MNNNTPIETFREIIETAISVRNKALYPDNPLFTLPLDLKGEEITEKERNLLAELLKQFDQIFEVGKNESLVVTSAYNMAVV